MIYFLDGNQEVIKIVRSEVVISAIQTQELPEDNSLLRDYLSVRLKNDERLFNAQYMAVKSYGGNRNAFDLYRIASELVPDNATEFMGVQVAPYELEGVVIEDLRPQDSPLNQTMNQVLEGSDWRLGYVADNLPNVTTNFYYMSVKDALKNIQELTKVEMLFKVEISGNKITDKWVEVYHQLGNRTMKRFNYGTNALSVVRESSHDELYTALIGRGKGEEVGETESGDATYGRKINFADVEWKVSEGKPVDKPKGQKYIELPNATAEYGIKLIDGRKVPRIGIVEFSETDDPEKLVQETYQELLVRARPKVLFKASVINTGDMLIGDTVTIHRHDLDFHYQARVRKVVRDRKNNNQTQVEIGDVVHTSSTKQQSNVNGQILDLTTGLENVTEEVTYAQSSADGKSTIFYGNVEPERKSVGDTWFRDHPSITGETQILVWNGEAWELIVDTSDTTRNAREIDAVIEQAQADKQALETEINQTYADAVAEADRLAAIRDNGITIEAGQIIAGTIDTARLDAVSIVTNGLSANVIKANHIQADNALFDKLFTSTLATDRLSAQSAWIKDGMFANASIDGAKITDATIGSAKIASLDVSKMTGNISSFIQTYWNGISSRMSADSTGLKINTTNNWDMFLGNSGITFTSKQGALTGALRATRTGVGDEAEGTFLIAEPGYLSGLGRRLSNGNLRGSLYVDGGTGSISVASDIGSNSEIRAPEYHIGSYNRLVRYVGSNELTTAAFEHRASASRGYDHTTDRIWLVRTTDTMTMYADINMNGMTITNQSDIRMKKNITDSGVNALKEIERLRFVNFEWDDTKGQDLKPKGVQFGIIAQHSPFLQMKTDDEESYLSVDMNKQVNLNSKASQELLAYTRSLEKRIEVLEGGGQ